MRRKEVSGDVEPTEALDIRSEWLLGENTAGCILVII